MLKGTFPPPTKSKKTKSSTKLQNTWNNFSWFVLRAGGGCGWIDWWRQDDYKHVRSQLVLIEINRWKTSFTLFETVHPTLLICINMFFFQLLERNFPLNNILISSTKREKETYYAPHIKINQSHVPMLVVGRIHLGDPFIGGRGIHFCGSFTLTETDSDSDSEMVQ